MSEEKIDYQEVMKTMVNDRAFMQGLTQTFATVMAESMKTAQKATVADPPPYNQIHGIGSLFGAVQVGTALATSCRLTLSVLSRTFCRSSLALMRPPRLSVQLSAVTASAVKRKPASSTSRQRWCAVKPRQSESSEPSSA
jgi:hypothetical protein